MIRVLAVIALVILPHLVYAQAKEWEKEWTEALEAAKKEGKLVVATSHGGNPRGSPRHRLQEAGFER